MASFQKQVFLRIGGSGGCWFHNGECFKAETGKVDDFYSCLWRHFKEFTEYKTSLVDDFQRSDQLFDQKRQYHAFLEAFISSEVNPTITYTKMRIDRQLLELVGRFFVMYIATWMTVKWMKFVNQAQGEVDQCVKGSLSGFFREAINDLGRPPEDASIAVKLDDFGVDIDFS